jgi:hypothetical protein
MTAETTFVSNERADGKTQGHVKLAMSTPGDQAEKLLQPRRAN